MKKNMLKISIHFYLNAVRIDALDGSRRGQRATYPE